MKSAMHLAPIDVSRVPRYRRIPAPTPPGARRAHADSIPIDVPIQDVARKGLNWFVVAFLAWEMSQIAIGVYYGVKLALVVT
jgi:hypothetical protein